MWNRDKDSGKWIDATQSMEKNVYDNYKQDQSKVMMYSKCLSGAVYFPTNNVDNIYDMTKYHNKTSWFYGTTSPYAIQQLPNHNQKQITVDNIQEFKSYARDYGMTVKNLFTTDKLIGANLKNFFEVDLITSTTDDINILAALVSGAVKEEVYVDGVRLKNGHTILVKDLIEIIALPFDTDPNSYFVGNYYKVEDSNSSSDDYKIYSKDNGLYTFESGKLIKTSTFDLYDNAYKLSLIAKLGTNKGKQFHLSRLLNGTFPTSGMPIEFLNGRNWVIRNVFDYNNIYDVVLNSILVTDARDILQGDITYIVPNRILSVGEFGTLINTEFESGIGSNRAHLINTKYKDTLNCIVETNKYYWACGTSGILLKIDIVTFDIVNIDLGTLNNLNKVAFYDNLNGVVVGDFGEIYITSNGGKDWTKQTFEYLQDNILLDVFFYKLNQIFIVGKHGLFIQLDASNGQWKPWVKQVIKTVDYYDEYLLHNDIKSIVHSTIPITINGDDGYGVISDIEITDYLFMCTSGGEIIIKCFNDKHEFVFMDLLKKQDIRGLACDNSLGKLYMMMDTIQVLTVSDLVLKIGGNSVSLDNDTDLVLCINAYTNSVNLDGNFIYSCGNSSSLFKNPKTSTQTEPILLDSNYGNSDKSKLLFLDYDIASKLTFFDDNGKYVLPESLTVPILNLKKLVLNSLPSEYNWISYYLDSLKKYEYFKQISDSNVVKYSTEFDATVGIYNLNTITNFVNSESQTGSNICLVSNNFSKFSELLPNAGVTTPTGFSANTPKLNRNEYGVFPSTAKDLFNAFGYCVMLYKYMMIIKMPSDSNNRVGAAFNIDSTYVETTVLVNKIHRYNNYDYLFFETDFNDSMVNSIIDSVNTLKITNLNIFTSADSLVANFNKHPLSVGYDLVLSETSISIQARFNNKTAYYNLQTKIGYLIDSVESSYNMLYNIPFIKFGYSPTYNILNYLGNINGNVFTLDKVFTSMPQYTNIPLNGINSSSDNNVFIDFGRIKTNYMSFGKDLYFEWETLWLHTFVDVDLIFGDGSEVSTEKLLITKKYELDNRYVIEFNNAINFTIGMADFVKFNIKSRNTLGMISSDLQTLNNIQRSTSVKKIGSGYVTNLKSELSSKFPTDSYCKILLSDYDVKDNLSGIIYTDYDNNLAFNVIKTENKIKLVINNAYQLNDKVVFNLSTEHGAKVGDYVIVRSNGGYVNPAWLGFAAIIEVIDDNTIRIEKDWGTPSATGCNAELYYVDSDPFLNYQPIDIMDLGVDIDVKQAVELNPSNIKVEGDIVSLVNVNYTKYRFTCVDGLSVSLISEKFPWILNAEITNAIIGYDEDGLIWYSGDWKCGRWFGNKWYSGRWFGGDWYSGTWESKKTTFDGINSTVANVNDTTSSKWFGGRWFGGVWNGGSWYAGRLYSVIWNGGVWNGGVWNGGTWVNGEFKGGIWVSGTWMGGIFNTDSNPAYWLGGSWGGGDFENGRWFGGEFSEKVNKSRFGTKSSNTRNSIWDSGNWLGGEFHSSLATLASGETVQSDIHKFSYWKTGTWGGGDFYGGTAYNISFNGGNWYGGISEDIELVNPDTLLNNTQDGSSNSGNKIRLNGVFRYNIGDEITINGDYRSNIGTDKEPITYRISSSYTDGVSYTDINLVSLAASDESFRLFLVFKKLDYAKRLGMVLTPSSVEFSDHPIAMDVYDHLKECLYGDSTGNKPYLALQDLNSVNNFISSTLREGYSDIDLNRLDLGLRVVSKFSNSNWRSGVWYNGVFESGSFTGGIWYNGNFKGQWG